MYVLKRWLNRLWDGTECRARLILVMAFVLSVGYALGFVVLIGSSLLSRYFEEAARWAAAYFYVLGVITISCLIISFLAYLSVIWEDLLDEKRKIKSNYGVTLKETLAREFNFEEWGE